MLFSFIADRLSFIAETMCPGLSSRADRFRKVVRVTAITREAGTPFPLTSPMQKKSRPSRMKKSYRSPPTSLAGTMAAARSMSCRSGKGGKTLGTIDIWMPRATLSSPSIFFLRSLSSL